ncbi:MAG: hypothetical protein HKP30_01435 [Myxococcales bacterium]|nr:hypothetical protein [Myxococcales bacterium]
MKALRSIFWMLALSLALGLAIGTCVRRDAEAPARYIGSAETRHADAGGPVRPARAGL